MPKPKKAKPRYEQASHLSNFSFEQRQVYVSPVRRQNTFLYREYDKEHFTRATFRFGCAPTGDTDIDKLMALALSDTNTQPPWEAVQVVFANFHLDQLPACPICLDAPPICPRVGKCGHFMCLVCAIRYFNSSKSASLSNKCPLCLEDMIFDDLKMVSFRLQHDKLTVGAQQEFVLVKRIKGSCQLMISGVESEQQKLFRNVLLVDDLYMYINEDKLELEKSLKNLVDIGGPDCFSLTPFYEMALMSLESHEYAWKQSSQIREAFSPSICQSSDIDNSFAFFQTPNGELCYLHSLNYRCLITEFGIENLPAQVSGEIVEIENITLDEVSLNKFRFLQHLPIYSQVSFCEIDLSSILSASTLDRFSQELDSRRRKREKRKQDIQKLEQKMKEAAKEQDIYERSQWLNFVEERLVVFEEKEDGEVKVTETNPPALRNWAGVANHGISSLSGEWVSLSDSIQASTLQKSKSSEERGQSKSKSNKKGKGTVLYSTSSGRQFK